MDERRHGHRNEKRKEKERKGIRKRGGGKDQKIHRQADSITQGKRNKHSADARVATLQ
jgi:hypothetical protein